VTENNPILKDFTLKPFACGKHVAVMNGEDRWAIAESKEKAQMIGISLNLLLIARANDITPMEMMDFITKKKEPLEVYVDGVLVIKEPKNDG
jgi:hypothetical protein